MDSVSRARFLGLRGRWILVTFGLLVAAGCGSKGPGTPDPPPIPNITITCPSDIAREDVTTATEPITFSTPTAAGGVPPVNVACSPSSGSGFPVGATVVKCDASDGTRNATCSFNVTRTARPTLRY